MLIKIFGLLTEELNGSSKKLQDEEPNEWYLLTYFLHEEESFLRS
jgi:hypothetical protein